MSDVLQDLADQITKSGSQQPVTQRQQPRPQPQTNLGTFVKAAGPGGVIFDFSQARGNPLADRFAALLNYHSDPQQVQIAKDQHAAYQKALGNFVDLGESRFNQSSGQGSFEGVHKAWNQQLSGSTDATIKKLYEEGKLVVDDPTSIEKGGAGMPQFGDAKINIGNETVHATSETDQAVMEMMKGGMLDEEE